MEKLSNFYFILMKRAMPEVQILHQTISEGPSENEEKAQNQVPLKEKFS